MHLIGITERTFKTKSRALKSLRWYKSRGYRAGYGIMDGEHTITVLHFGYKKWYKCSECGQSAEKDIEIVTKEAV